MSESLIQFGHSFQKKIIILLVFDTPFLQTINDIIEPDYFDSDADKWLVKKINSYFLKYKVAPTMEALSLEIKKIKSDILRKSVVENLKEAYNHREATDFDYVKEHTLNFCKNQTLKNAIMDSVDLLERQDYDGIKSRIDDAMKAGTSKDLGHDYITGLEERMTQTTRKTIPTGWDIIDEIMGSGLGGGELGVIVAPAGVGKSWCLQKLSQNAIGIGKTVVHYTLELNASYVGLRYDTIFSGVPTGDLKFYDLKTREEKLFAPKVTSFKIYDDKILVFSNNNLRLLPLANPPLKEILVNNKFSEKSGLINLDRIKLSINPTEEWKQMYSEAWRLQRDYFWVSNMSGINWKKVYKRYYSLIDRVSTRSEFSDLLWEMQGELGTSHCYEMGGDYKPRRNYFQGLMGANLVYNNKKNAYEIKKIFKGDLWENPQSPLLRPGLNIVEGDFIKKINNESLTKKITPGHLLVNLPNSEVLLQIINKSNNKKRTVTVKTLVDQKHLQYRDWVEANKTYVHKKSKNKIGYIHIPDMGVAGFSEFHRHYLSEINYDGLIIDVRYNGGGHISQLLLSKLARKRLGYDLTRCMGQEPYPVESPAGPMVAITNEFAGSDGDIFSHSWKMMKLGKLIGKRTWGGVIGIWPRNSLVDGTVTTQPEFSFWFKDVGWGVENHGADVDIEIDNFPQDFIKGIDNQLDKGIEIVENEMSKKGAILKPDFKDKPNLKLP